MSENMEQLTFSQTVFLVIVYEDGIGFRAPILAYADKAVAWSHFLEMVSNYPGDKSKLHCMICGEFDPFNTAPIKLYDEFIEVTASVACDSEYFDHYLIDSVNKFLTHNKNSFYKLDYKDPVKDRELLNEDLISYLEAKNATE